MDLAADIQSQTQGNMIPAMNSKKPIKIICLMCKLI